MPLMKSRSKKAFQENVKTEMGSGKPQDQSLAIAYNVQRNSRKRKNMDKSIKMAMGGEVGYKEAPSSKNPGKPRSGVRPADLNNPGNYGHHDEMMDDEYYAEGGFVDSDERDEDSIADRIMKRRRRYADGGQVDIDSNAQETSFNMSPFDEDNEEAVLKELYDDEQLGPQPEDSNEHGRDIDSDRHDMVDMIRRRMKMRRP